MNSNRHIFVYGTLLSEIKNPMHAVLASRATLLGPAIMPGSLYDRGGYPGATENFDKGRIVRGELYLINDADQLLPLLDAYEECDGLSPDLCEYLRAIRPVTLTRTNEQVFAWVYLYNRPVESLSRIPHGDYVQYVQKW